VKASPARAKGTPKGRPKKTKATSNKATPKEKERKEVFLPKQ
jgi:hypothetical protein